MTITVFKDKGFEDGFITWLLPVIRDYVISSVDENKLIKVDEHINNNKYFHTIFKNKISSKDVIVAAMYNLVVNDYWNRTIISVDNNAIVPNTTTKISTVIKTVNFGTMSIMGYPIITTRFKYIEDNIDAFYEMYLRGK